jgi:hypothetical protein
VLGDSAKQGVANIDRTIGDRKDFAGLFDFGFDTKVRENIDDLPGVHAAKRSQQCFARPPERVCDTPFVAMVSHVAPRPAGHQDLHTELGIFFQK